MVNKELKVIIFLLCMFLLTVSVYPVFAVDYNPGVSVGQYVKYGNFVLNNFGGDINDWGSLLTEVVAVSGQEVTLNNTGQFKNGTAIPYMNQSVVINIANSSFSWYNIPPIIATNLTEGDLLPSTYPTFFINKTETKMYLNVGRSVNIVNFTVWGEASESKYTIVYDRASGMMLENLWVYNSTSPAYISSMSYSVIETNIFAVTEQPFYLQPWFLITLIVIVAIVIVIMALWMRRKPTLNPSS